MRKNWFVVCSIGSLLLSGCTQVEKVIERDLGPVAQTLDRGAKSLGVNKIGQQAQQISRGGLAFRAPDSSGYILLPARDGGAACRVKFPKDFFQSSEYLRYPADLDDFAKATASDHRCSETENNYPRTHSDRGKPLSVWTNYTMTRAYSERIDPRFSKIHFSISGDMKNGVFQDETRIVLYAYDQKGKEITGSTVQSIIDSVFSNPPSRDDSINNRYYRTVFVSNGRFLRSRQDDYNQRDKISGYQDLFDVRLSFVSDSDGEITEANAARLISAKGGFTDYKVRYSITPKNGVNLDASTYKFKIHTRIDLVIEGKPGGVYGALVSNIEKKVLEKDFDIIVSKSDNYRKMGVQDIGRALTSGSGTVVIFDVNQSLKSAKPSAYVKEFSSQ